MYTVIALAVLLSAAWLGLNFANRLVAPIRRLIGAANIVSTGNLYIQVPVLRSEGDLGQLGETFNRMTHELRTQRDDIVRARDLIDQRRRFTEAVLAGASAGVIGVDGEGRISYSSCAQQKSSSSPRERPTLSISVVGNPAGAEGHFLQRLVERATFGSRASDPSVVRTASATCRCASPPSSRRIPSAATSSRSTTSPSW